MIRSVICSFSSCSETAYQACQNLERPPSLCYPEADRGVAQLGSAPAWGAGGRWFESSLPDFHNPCFYNCVASRTILTSDMASSTVELAELLNVIGSKRDDLTLDSLTTISPNNSRSGITTIRIWAEAPGSKSTRLHDIRPADSEDPPCDVTI